MTASSSPSSAPSAVRSSTDTSAHEQVVFCHDRQTGLRAIIGIYSTALGPALGGTRFYPYESEDAALADVLRLSKGMAYKNAVAGLDLGGGKAVIIGDPATDKTPDLLRAYGRFVESLGGRYVTACDVGTYVADMDVVSETTRFATGRSEANGGAGDSSVLTAFGVFQGQRAAAQHLWGEPTLKGRTVGIAGVGKVGRILAGHLLEDGADVVVTDVNEQALAALKDKHPQIEVVPDTATLVTSDIDVYAPCALGGALDDTTVEALRATVVCGGANNQLVTEGDGRHRRPAPRARHHLRPRLPGQRRWRHPGQRRAARLRLRARQEGRRGDLRPHPGGAARPPTSAASPLLRPPTTSPRSGWRPGRQPGSGCRHAEQSEFRRGETWVSPQNLRRSCSVVPTTHTRFPGPLRGAEAPTR